jgi:hypothetical protein
MGWEFSLARPVGSEACSVLLEDTSSSVRWSRPVDTEGSAARARRGGDQLVEPKQQPQSRLTIAIQDCLRLGPLHTLEFAPAGRVPSREVNAYVFCFESDIESAWK